MEYSIFSLAYQGSISEAIAEAKRQKKLFIVYISGDNPESTHLEESTWMDSKVAETISKYSILLHISEGSDAATNFSAIYPQNSTPCIAAIGYNGVQIWQNEGFVSADILTSSVEKAWLSLHIQETTATFLAAALASKNSETHGSNGSNTALSVEGSPSTMDAPSPSTNKHAQYSEARAVAASSEMESEGCIHSDEKVNSKLGDGASPGSVFANVLESVENESASFSIGTPKESFSPLKLNPDEAGVCDRSSGARDECPSLEGNVDVVDHHSEDITETSPVIANDATEVVHDKNAEALEDDKIELEVIPETYRVIANRVTETVQDKKTDSVVDKNFDVPDSCSRSTEVHLNIRLPDGAYLQEKFVLTSTLRMVKDYVDENQASAASSYDLAIPYPRKVFVDQDLNKTLSELLLFGRQSLLVVPRHRATGYHRGGPSSGNQTNTITELDSSNGSNKGYLAYVKKILSYINPFSYLGGGASSLNSAQISESGMWQYEQNPSPPNNLRGAGTPYSVYSSGQSAPAADRKKSESGQATASRIGSNIHTLKHDEDDSQFKDRNTFWNGNSTEYGGDNDAK